LGGENLAAIDFYIAQPQVLCATISIPGPQIAALFTPQSISEASPQTDEWRSMS
jgi:hypothetical protein